MSHWAASLFATGLEALMRKRIDGQSSLGVVVKSIWRYPIKMIAAFLVAPFLAFRVAALAKNPVRRLIAGVGFFLSILAAWLAGTFLGTVAGALLIAAKVGMLWGLAFIIGTTLSVVLSVAFSILVMNAVAFFFLHMSSEEVVAYLRSLSD